MHLLKKLKIWLKTISKKLLNHNNPESLIKITISKSSLLHNLSEFKKLNPQNTIAPVLKGNAYGHGLVEVASIVKDQSELLIVDSYFEAKKLRENNIKNHLLVIGYVRPENMNCRKLRNISYTITSLEMLKSIESATKIHLKIDTGMHRQGILPSEISEAFEYIKNNKSIALEGICSHFADADNADTAFTEKQIALWNTIVENAQKTFPTIKYTHISNTFGHTFSDKITASTSRLGIGLYGLVNIKGLDLKPVLEMKTIITGIKKIKKEDSVGYGVTFTANKDMIIATIPLGYYEGLDRNLSNKGFVKVQNTMCPIVGRISMNITIVDISALSNAKIGDEVLVISSYKKDLNSIESMAKIAAKINYEISVKIPSDIRRIVV